MPRKFIAVSIAPASGPGMNDQLLAAVTDDGHIVIYNPQHPEQGPKADFGPQELPQPPVIDTGE